MDKALATIQFQRYIVEKIDFRLNPSYSSQVENPEIDLDISFNHKLAVDTEENFAQLTLSCEISKDYLDSNKPFFLAVEMVGLFSYDTILDSDKRKQLLLRNGSAILFPYLRAIISMITSISSIPALVLPTMNIAKLLIDNNEENGTTNEELPTK